VESRLQDQGFQIMTKRLDALVKRITPFLAAGMLLQASGCDLTGTTSGLVTSIANALITNFVFGVFGLTP
jgi:hypothetical protein